MVCYFKISHEPKKPIEEKWKPVVTHIVILLENSVQRNCGSTRSGQQMLSSSKGNPHKKRAIYSHENSMKSSITSKTAIDRTLRMLLGNLIVSHAI